MFLSIKKLDFLQKILLYIFVFLLPWQIRYIFQYLKLGNSQYEYGKLSIYLSEVALLLLFFVFIINWIFFGIKKSKTRYGFLIPSLFFIVCSIGYFFANDNTMFYYGMLRISEASFLLFVISKMNFSRIRVYLAFISSMIVHAIIGIIQFYEQYIGANKYFGISEQISSNPGASVIESFSSRFLRAYGGFSHPNIFAGFLVIAIVFLLLIYIKKYKESKALRRIIFWFSFIVLFSGLIITFSRSAFLALLICFIVFIILSIYKNIFKKILPIFIVVFFVFLINSVIFFDLLKTRTYSNERLEIKSNTERIELISQASKIIESNYLFGVGINNYVPYVYKNVDQNLNVWDYQPVHNVYLLILSEIGIFGLILYLSMLLVNIFYIIKFKNYFYILPTLVILIVNFFDHYFFTSFSGLLLSFLIIGISSDKDLQNFS